MRDGVRVHPSQLTASIPTADALIDEPGQDAPAIIDGTRRRAVPAAEGPDFIAALASTDPPIPELRTTTSFMPTPPFVRTGHCAAAAVPCCVGSVTKASPLSGPEHRGGRLHDW
jgi:hypothetical protein